MEVLLSNKIKTMCMKCDEKCQYAFDNKFLFTISNEVNGIFSTDKQNHDYFIVNLIAYLVGGSIIAFSCIYSVTGIIYLMKRIKLAKQKKKH